MKTGCTLACQHRWEGGAGSSQLLEDSYARKRIQWAPNHANYISRLYTAHDGTMIIDVVLAWLSLSLTNHFHFSVPYYGWKWGHRLWGYYSIRPKLYCVSEQRFLHHPAVRDWGCFLSRAVLGSGVIPSLEMNILNQRQINAGYYLKSFHRPYHACSTFLSASSTSDMFPTPSATLLIWLFWPIHPSSYLMIVILVTTFMEEISLIILILTWSKWFETIFRAADRSESDHMNEYTEI